MISDRLNPMIVREMRSRMRGRRAFIVITIYLMLLSCLAGSVYTFIYSENVSQTVYGINAPNVQYGPTIGKSIFTGTVFLLLTIITFISPAFTAGAIAGEKERQTYEVLIITPMKASKIVWGKLGAVVGFLVLLILASLPIQSFAFLFGGVALPELLITMVGLIVTATAFGALGLFVSSLARTTMIAILIVYGFGIPFVFGLPFLWLYFFSMFSTPLISLMPSSPAWFLVVPLIYGLAFLISINPFTSAIFTGLAASEGYGYFFIQVPVGSHHLWFVSPWLIYVIFYTLLTILLVYLTTRRVATISKK